jgi:hypothetical protein
MKSNFENQAIESESSKFDTVVRRLLSVSREEIQKRDKEWRRKRAQKKQAKAVKARRNDDK